MPFSLVGSVECMYTEKRMSSVGRECLSGFGGLCVFKRGQFCAKDAIPESARDAETVLVISEMVLQMIFLEVAIICGETVFCQ